MAEIMRCGWPGDNALMVRYHDEEWGTPLYDDRKLFEFLVLDAFQAGLSWSCVLNKRENFRAALAGFDPAKIAKYGQADIDRLLNDSCIIRNRLKIMATIGNAQRFLEIQKEFGSFSEYIWQFTGGKPLANTWTELSQIPARSPESDAMSKDLVKRGFRFVGSTICYAFMQAAGIVNDHLVSCFRYEALAEGIRKSDVN